MTPDFDLGVLWPTFKAAGMLQRVSIKPKAGGAARTGDVGYIQPDVLKIDGSATSREHRIEYQAADFPGLAEGDVVTFLDADDEPVPKMKFRVRRPPYVSDNQLDGDDGTYLLAVLTKI